MISFPYFHLAKYQASKICCIQVPGTRPTDRVAQNETKDIERSQKIEKLYWRGATTSCYPQDGTWYCQQRFLQKVKNPGLSKGLGYKDHNDSQASGWPVKELKEEGQQDFSDLYEVHITLIGHCALSDWEEKRSCFNIYNDTVFQEAWENKFLFT